jgi:ABC-2 type transport system permease protein
VTRLVRAEARKLLSTQVWFWLLLGALAITALFVVFTILADTDPDNPLPPLDTAEGQRNLIANSANGSLLVCILGIIALSGEYRHLTITPTFLVSPHRGRVVTAKMVTYALVGLGFGVLQLAVVLAIALPWLSARGISLSLTENRIPAVLLAVMLVLAIWGILGVGIASLIRNQVAAVVITVSWLFLVEGILSSLPWTQDHLSKWLPGQASNAALEVAQEAAGGGDLLEPWQGGLLLTAYAVVFAFLGWWLAVRRDVT